MFRRILIANRGEVALRIARAARELGVSPVGVVSEADRDASWTAAFDQVVTLGPAAAKQSYLDPARVLQAARQTHCTAVHPGWGFLAEDARFAARATELGLTFVGPTPDAIARMGQKSPAKEAMRSVDLPVVPGSVGLVKSLAEAEAAAQESGYPLLLKADAGGGGRGMRKCDDASQLADAFAAASAEAESAFANGDLYLEKYLTGGRHIEVQLLCDRFGSGVHLFERECSIQRRHQKLLEEAPSPTIDEATRNAMGEAALQAARAVGYVGAGTVEFLYSKGEFFFLEMNTRLQVEHPITEMITGIDLVREQLRVAAGEELGYDQSAIAMHGHAIEVRINAEEPKNNFLPSTGTVQNLRLPGGPWVRLDSALYNGLEVGLNYDPMLAKLIVWGADRDQAMERMRRALQELNVGGVSTGAPAALRVLQEERFRAGDYDTHFLESLDLTEDFLGMADVAALAAAVYRHHKSRRRALQPSAGRRDGWLERGRRQLTDYPLPPSTGGQA